MRYLLDVSVLVALGFLEKLHPTSRDYEFRALQFVNVTADG
jgi:hypothetical protein